MKSINRTWLLLAIVACFVMSTSGQTKWTKTKIPGNPKLTSVVWNGKQYAAITGGSSAQLFTSSDAISWKKVQDHPAWSYSSVVWTSTSLVITATDAIELIFTDADTLTDSVKFIQLDIAINSVTWDGTKLVGVGSNNFIRTSVDGITWKTVNPEGANSSSYYYGLGSISWSAGQFVAVGDTAIEDYSMFPPVVLRFHNYLMASVDGNSWKTSEIKTSYNNSFNEAIWTGSQYIVVGDTNNAGSLGVILNSTDGNSWTNVALPGMSKLNSVAWSGKSLVVVGNQGEIASSPDGISWTGVDTSWFSTYLTLGNLYCVIFTGTKFVAVGDSGTVLTSPSDSPLAVVPNAIALQTKHDFALTASRGYLTLSLPDRLLTATTNISIFCMSGRRVMSFKSLVGAASRSFDIRALRAGVYNVVVRCNETILQKAFTVCR
jgi:hypothetical protein